ncbi:Oidioi.mRNA.OKI2018_I69.PAR.g12676.t1.cds [Oikopleura dioica]|uniref:Oidioi.mRNA.OKI2018_I69.PAR.g12676.t1.cds n=1 Tax=Oikopleura dioica TaxID=34765 RepID=A0ABN7S7C6_OIKDI|nr:Oidioi.mRNA.OKI2018_I69.PAR.g12676.t1.cds [Oikopleura dioica]
MIGVSFSFLTLLAVSKAQEEITSATIEAKPIEKSRCGREYFCFSFDCEFGEENCPYVAWKETEENEDFVTVKLFYNSPSPAYVAIGFSRDKSMGQDDIFFCQRNEQNQVAIVSSFSRGMSKPTNLGSTNVEPETRLTNIGLGSDGNTFFCEFDRPKSLVKDNIVYDLADGDWFVLLATGAVGGSQAYHGGVNRAASSISWKLSDPPLDFFGDALDISAMKIHAILMFVAWGILVPSGLFIGRFFKRGYPKKMVKSKPIWFQFHRLLMVLSVILTIVGIILIFVNRQGWSESAAENGHAFAGIIVFAFGLMNPIIAMFRPDPDSENRKYFNVCHHSIGYLAQVGAVVAIFLGFDLAVYDLEFVSTQIYAAFIVISAIISILLELFKGRVEKASFAGINVYSICSAVYFMILLPFTITLLVHIGRFDGSTDE